MTDRDVGLAQAIAPHLPPLRRLARALTGSQDEGDALVAATLEAILQGSAALDAGLAPRIALFRTFVSRWTANATTSGAAASLSSQPASSPEQTAQRRLAPLSPPARLALLLTALEGFSAAEAGQIMALPEAEASALAADAVAAIATQITARVMIIEDEPIIAMDLEAIVDELGHSVVGVADTRHSAVSLARDQRPDLVLSDVQLADGSSGVDAVRDILASFTAPVIFVTAYPERLLTGDKVEPAFLIAKPFRADAVQAAIGQALFFHSDR